MNILKEYTKFMVFSLLLAAAITCLIGALLAYTNISDNMLGTLVFVGISTSIFSGSTMLNRKFKKRGYLYGLLFGIIFFALIYTFSSLASSALVFNTTVLVYLIMSLATRSNWRNNWRKHIKE